ncbi:MAG: hypothetical protein JRD93_16850 [Deltaproteobacteria bacterium]|nr:hypothetical protein [Deltaproteobacteria bacterium]
MFEDILLAYRETVAYLYDKKKKAIFFIKNPREILVTDRMNNLVSRTRELAFENANYVIFIAHVLGGAWVEIDGSRSYGYSRVLYVDTPVGQMSFPVYHEFWNQLETFPIYDTRKVLPLGEERVYEYKESKWDTHSAQDSIFRLAQLYDLVEEGKLLDFIKLDKPEIMKNNPKKNKHARRKNR